MSILDMVSYLVETENRETALKANLGAIRADYDRLLGEHESTKWYLVEKTKEFIKAQNEADMLTKKFSRVMKLSGFSYQVGEAKGIKVI